MSGAAAVNLHASAIVVGVTGILITGPSGCGKSALALALIEAGRHAGLFAALVADDQVLASAVNGRLLAEAPAAIAGLAEIRGTGIVPVKNLSAAVMDFALLPAAPGACERLPPCNERFEAMPGLALPLARLLWPAPEPFSRLAALCPGLADGLPARPLMADC